jgi:hypothetical protein
VYGLAVSVNAQDFYGEYQKFEIKESQKKRVVNRRAVEAYINENIKFLHKTADEYKRVSGYSILSNKNIFIVDLLDTGYVCYKVIWAGKKSCYYKYTPKSDTSGKVSFQGFEIKADASSILKKLSKKTKMWILSGDTSNFKKYASDLLNSPYCCFISISKCEKQKDNRWRFTRTSSYSIEL